MVHCKRFQKGNCTYGDTCSHDHVNIKEHIQNDAVSAVNGSQYLLSCYGPFWCKPSIPNFVEDQSFEEVRLNCYEAKKNGMFAQYKKQYEKEMAVAQQKYEDLIERTKDVLNTVATIYDTPCTKHTSRTELSREAKEAFFCGGASRKNFLNDFGTNLAQETQQAEAQAGPQLQRYLDIFQKQLFELNNFLQHSNGNNSNAPVFGQQSKRRESGATATENNVFQNLITQMLEMRRELKIVNKKVDHIRSDSSSSSNINVRQGNNLSCERNIFNWSTQRHRQIEQQADEDALTDTLTCKSETTDDTAFEMLNTELSDIRSDLDAVKVFIEQHLNSASEIETLKIEVNDLKQKYEKHENVNLSGDLRIRGIPYNESENLYEFFNTLCRAVNIIPPKVQDVFRIPRVSPITNAPDIILQLSSAKDRTSILQSIAIFRRKQRDQLRLKHLGLNSDSRFYVNESLTKSNYSIYRRALQLKREGKLHAVYTKRGYVHVKMDINKPFIRIDSEEKLIEFDRM